MRAWFHKLDRARNVQAGKDLLDKELRALGLLSADLAPVLEKFHVGQRSTSCTCRSRWATSARTRSAARCTSTNARASGAGAAAAAARSPRHAPRTAPRKPTNFTVEGVGNLLVQLARCCQPVPGEPIVGYLTRGRGVSMHRAGLRRRSQRLAGAQPQRVLPVEWGAAGSGYEVDVQMLRARSQVAAEGPHQPDRAGQTRTCPASSSDVERAARRVRLRLRLRVADFGQLSTLLGKLACVPGVEQRSDDERPSCRAAPDRDVCWRPTCNDGQTASRGDDGAARLELATRPHRSAAVLQWRGACRR